MKNKAIWTLLILTILLDFVLIWQYAFFTFGSSIMARDVPISTWVYHSAVGAFCASAAFLGFSVSNHLFPKMVFLGFALHRILNIVFIWWCWFLNWPTVWEGKNYFMMFLIALPFIICSFWHSLKKNIFMQS